MDRRERDLPRLDPQVSQLYVGVREVLANYKSGKLPKAFKVIPTLTNWEQIMQITSPEKWTAASMCAATKLFTTARDEQAQTFFNLVLLPRIRDDIHEFKKLNPHLYQALRYALFKPAAFFKGIILPLCETSSETTLREAVIISSILQKKSIPMLHSAAAMLKIAEMPFSGTNYTFLLALVSKNYAMPFRVVDAMVAHFLRFMQYDELELPVIWHQTLLKFVELYHKDIAPDQKAALLELLRKHTHHKISPCTREYLTNKEQ